MINKIKENLKNVLAQINEKYEQDILDISNIPDHIYKKEKQKRLNEIKEFEKEQQDYLNSLNPYEQNPWSGVQLYCFICGNSLKEIAKDDKTWDYLWREMLEHRTLYFQCSNTKCCHNSAPLLLHNSVNGHNRPAGDNYSLSWIK